MSIQHRHPKKKEISTMLGRFCQHNTPDWYCHMCHPFSTEYQQAADNLRRAAEEAVLTALSEQREPKNPKSPYLDRLQKGCKELVASNADLHQRSEAQAVMAKGLIKQIDELRGEALDRRLKLKSCQKRIDAKDQIIQTRNKENLRLKETLRKANTRISVLTEERDRAAAKLSGAQHREKTAKYYLEQTEGWLEDQRQETCTERKNVTLCMIFLLIAAVLLATSFAFNLVFIIKHKADAQRIKKSKVQLW